MIEKRKREQQVIWDYSIFFEDVSDGKPFKRGAGVWANVTDHEITLQFSGHNAASPSVRFMKSDLKYVLELLNAINSDLHGPSS